MKQDERTISVFTSTVWDQSISKENILRSFEIAVKKIITCSNKITAIKENKSKVMIPEEEMDI